MIFAILGGRVLSCAFRVTGMDPAEAAGAIMSVSSLSLQAPPLWWREWFSARWRFAALGATFFAYAALYAPLYALLGAMVGSLEVLSALLGGWLFGRRGGFAASLMLALMEP